MTTMENVAAQGPIDAGSITLDAEGRVVVLDPALLDEISGAAGVGDEQTDGFLPNFGCSNVNCGQTCGSRG
jgi:hypothetical protein